MSPRGQLEQGEFYVRGSEIRFGSYALIVILCKLYEIDWNIERVRRKGDGEEVRRWIKDKGNAVRTKKEKYLSNNLNESRVIIYRLKDKYF